MPVLPDTNAPSATNGAFAMAYSLTIALTDDEVTMLDQKRGGLSRRRFLVDAMRREIKCAPSGNYIIPVDAADLTGDSYKMSQERIDRAMTADGSKLISANAKPLASRPVVGFPKKGKAK